MIKSELIAKLAGENPHLTQKDVERVVGVILERMTQALESGGRVELRGFGCLFGPFASRARSGRNPSHRRDCVGEGQACALLQERARNCVSG